MHGGDDFTQRTGLMMARAAAAGEGSGTGRKAAAVEISPTEAECLEYTRNLAKRMNIGDALCIVRQHNSVVIHAGFDERARPKADPLDGFTILPTIDAESDLWDDDGA